MSRPTTTPEQKLELQRLRQQRYYSRNKWKIKRAKKEYNQFYYQKNKDRIKFKRRARYQKKS
jgi:hypothetical protein